MAKGRELKGRIKSVENTRKITRTMRWSPPSQMSATQIASSPRVPTQCTPMIIANLYTPELAERFGCWSPAE